jgi:hypothetical protein
MVMAVARVVDYVTGRGYEGRRNEQTRFEEVD